MNIKPWIATSVTAVVVSMALTAAPAYADRHYAVSKTRASHDVYDYAKVLSAEPIVRVCNGTKNPSVNAGKRPVILRGRAESAQDRPAARLLGAIIGGVVGNQFGSGRGNDAAAIAGTADRCSGG